MTRSVRVSARVDMDIVRRRHRGHWFETSSMRFFDSRVAWFAYQSNGGDAYFVSSEQFHGSDGSAGPRLYTVRRQDRETGGIDTVGEFQGWPTRYAADKEAQRLAREGGQR